MTVQRTATTPTGISFRQANAQGLASPDWFTQELHAMVVTQKDFADAIAMTPAAVSRFVKGQAASKSLIEGMIRYFKIAEEDQLDFARYIRGGSSLIPQIPAHPLAGSARRNNLPRQLTTLVGRADVCGQAVDLLQENTLVTLTGEAGIGKTRLALAVGEDLLGSFADGIYFVALAAVRETDRVIAAIAAALDVKEAGGGGRLLDRLKDHLRDRELLLILDNFEQVQVAAPLITDLLRAAPRLKALITSREALQVEGEQVFRLAPLTSQAATTLFSERARAVQTGFCLTGENESVIAAICARLDGLPLALELAAARSTLFSPPALLARLDQRLIVLTGGRADSPLRHQTLRAALAWSYDLLLPAEQRLFRQLAVFAGGWTLDAAAAVCGLTDLTTLDTVDSLLTKSLIYRSETNSDPRFAMLETIREYAAEQLAASGDESVLRQAHADYYLQLAENAATLLEGAEQTRWLDRLDQEQDNFRSALSWAKTQDGDTTARLTGALWPYWQARSHWTEGRQWIAAALAGRIVTHEQRARLLLGAGTLARLQGDSVQAHSWLDESRTAYRILGDQRGEAACLYELADLARLAEDRATSLRLGAESLALARRTQDSIGIIRALLFCIDENEDGQDATRRYQEALQLSQEQQYLPGIAMAKHRLAGLAEEQGDLPHATALYEESLSLFHELGDQRRIATVTEILGELMATDNPLQARTYFEQALTIWRQIGGREGLLSVAYNLAGLAHAAADWSTTAVYAAQGLREARAAGNVRGIRDGLLLLGHAHIHLSQLTEASATYNEALGMLNGATPPALWTRTLLGFALLAASDGRLEDAASLLGAIDAQGPLSGHEQADYEGVASVVRVGFDAPTLAATWTVARAWTVAETLAWLRPDRAAA